ncbi:MAG: hypothetical protein FD161_2734 [Limisphaerales bacterium]|nr:MAG: hypothetical protein FD161_2734 [Limisphaerales bacterium]KAG0508378.1 MAG: hypothetical protein E1N63_2485 [Limisphaerales bacterium]TXT51981.1 MAG: hypothetical protein FD140_1103 [Limisphaerales bacterium]
MNRIIATTGIAALGAAVCQPALAQDAKPWNVTASVRTFYDDNYLTLPKGGKRSSWGTDFSPSGVYKLTHDQTVLDLSARYGMRYYEDRRENSADHSFNLGVQGTHQFTERFKIKASDSFTISQEPGVLDPGAVATPLRTQGNNLGNIFDLNFSAVMTSLLTLEAAYSNKYYDYQQTGLGSRSALLDRVEHLFTLNSRWQVFENTVALAGYSFGLVDQTSKDIVAAPGVTPDARDSRSHYLFIGADHTFSPEFSVSGRFGYQLTEFPNVRRIEQALAITPLSSDTASNPFVDLSGTYALKENSMLQLGIKHSRAQSDVVVLDSEATVVYWNLNYEFTPLINASLIGQYQLTTFNQSNDPVEHNKSDNFFSVGCNLEYKFTQFWSAEAGYNYDRLDSDLNGRSYYRNRIYLGFKATW